MPSNLPPGVTESMIPGNRPEDEWQDQFWDLLELPDWAFDYTPSEFAELIHKFLRIIHETNHVAVTQYRHEQEIDEAAFGSALDDWLRENAYKIDHGGARDELIRIAGHDPSFFNPLITKGNRDE
jgi:hypothetical protein